MKDALICAALALPARIPADYAARAFQNAMDHVISNWDTLFQTVVASDAFTFLLRTFIAWDAWLTNGFTTALVAALLSRALTRRPLGWRTIAMVTLCWTLVRLLVWNWDRQLLFRLDGTFQPWPWAGSAGFLTAFAFGLVCAGQPWRIKR